MSAPFHIPESAPVDHEWEIDETRLLAELLAIWKPAPKLTLSGWVRANMSNEQGEGIRPFAYQAGILDSLGDPSVREVAWIKSARVGGSMIGTAVTLHDISQGRRVGFAMSRESDCRDYSATVLAPSIDYCKPVADILSSAQGGSSNRDTLLQKSFGNGGSIRLLNYTSLASARRISLDTIILDEAETAESETEEGNVVDLLRKRVSASAMPRIFHTSTPVEEGLSQIQAQYERGDQRIYEVPCPECAGRFELQPEGLHIDGRPVLNMNAKDLAELPEDFEVEHACPHCGSFIPERQKRWMVNNGDWRATAKGERGVVSFRSNALVSLLPSAAWHTLATEWMRANGKPADERVVVNTLWGRPYSSAIDEGLTLDAVKLHCRPVNLTLISNTQALRLTAGVDVQENRLEIALLGASDNGFVILDHQRMHGDPTGSELWSRLEDYTAKGFNSDLCGTLYIDAVAVDSGYMAQTVYEQCAKRATWYAIKGVDGPAKPLWRQSKSKPSARFDAHLFLIGVDSAKEWIATRIMDHDDLSGNYLQIADHLADDIIEQLIAEERRHVASSGRRSVRWFPRNSTVRSELLDCTVYALAAHHSLGEANWDRLRDDLTVQHGSESKGAGGFRALGERLGSGTTSVF
ncbi:terminase gpA endonuclease subunit [Oricola indica]|uniref:terminase gpA endonuclease subunit n=1 Tax=Oricola indica TaxID=2872591 RepID=UPI001CBB870F|nr:terminase gpA endonuclease subunit [Oricola indica]